MRISWTHWPTTRRELYSLPDTGISAHYFMNPRECLSPMLGVFIPVLLPWRETMTKVILKRNNYFVETCLQLQSLAHFIMMAGRMLQAGRPTTGEIFESCILIFGSEVVGLVWVFKPQSPALVTDFLQQDQSSLSFSNSPTPSWLRIVIHGSMGVILIWTTMHWVTAIKTVYKYVCVNMCV